MSAIVAACAVGGLPGSALAQDDGGWQPVPPRGVTPASPQEEAPEPAPESEPEVETAPREEPRAREDSDRGPDADAGSAAAEGGGFGGLSGFDPASATPMEWANIVLVATAPLVLIILWLADVIRPGSFKRKGKRDVSGYPVIIWLFGLFVIFSAQQFGAQVGLALPGLFGAADEAGLPVETLSENPLRDQAIVLATSALFALVAGGVMMYLLGAKSDKDGLRIRASDLPVGLAAIALSVPLLVVASQGAMWVYERMHGAAPDVVAHEMLRTIIDHQQDPAAWAMMLLVIVALPIVEELMYRAFLQTALLRLFGSAWAAILVTSVAFTWIHTRVGFGDGPMVPWYALPGLFCLSVAMGVAFERTKRIGVPMAMHIAFNAVNVGLALAVVEVASPVAPAA